MASSALTPGETGASSNAPTVRVGGNSVAATGDSSSSNTLGNTTRTENGQTVFKHAVTGIEIRLQNVVATVNLSVALNLKHIALRVRNAEYNPQRFSAVIMRIRDPKATALVFASGKMVVTGLKSEHDSKLAARKFAKTLTKLSYKVKSQEFKVQNIVGTLNCRFAIRLEGLAYAHGKFASYEPEIFPGIVYRMVSPKVVVLIFVSGKVVITGGKYETDIYEAFDKIYAVLLEYKKETLQAPPT